MELGERLADARRERGLTQQDAAAALAVARTTITAIEKGARRPRPSELARLAVLYGRSIADFARPRTESSAPSFHVQFRESGRNDHPEPGRNQAVRQFEQLCRWFREMERDAGIDDTAALPAPYALQSLSPVQAGELMASSERNRLGLGDGPIGNLWRALEMDVGLRIFGFPMKGTRIAGMFVYSDELGACVALNANHPIERQRWTLAHEYAHLLNDRFRPEISVLGTRGRKDRSEQIADAFALHFLMPSAGLIRRFQALQVETGGKITPGEILQLGHLYGVSAESMTHRLEDVRLIPTDTWDQLTSAGFQPNAARHVLGIETVKTGRARLPGRYVSLCVRAYQAGDFSEGQLAERLMTDRAGARQYVVEMSETAVLRDDGELQLLALDLQLDLLTPAR